MRPIFPSSASNATNFREAARSNLSNRFRTAFKMLIAKRQSAGVSPGKVLLKRCVFLLCLVDHVLTVFKVGVYGAALGMNGSLTERHRIQPNIVAPVRVLDLWGLIHTREPRSKDEHNHFEFLPIFKSSWMRARSSTANHAYSGDGGLSFRRMPDQDSG
jgi:hypothetical protein